MNIAFYNGVSGMMAYQEDMNRISHNVANSSTFGFKPSRSTFHDLIYTRMAVNSEEEPLTGHGVRIGEGNLLYRQGPALQTGNTLDFALMGDGFFAVKRPDGDIEYTRNGAFQISLEGTQGFLTTADGSHVLDGAGNPIQLTDTDGDGVFDTSDLESRLLAAIYDFPNPYGLEYSNDSCFTPTETSGEAQLVVLDGTSEQNGRIYRLQGGAVEQSAVEIADEMVNMIVTQKAFQLNAKMVQTADEIEQIVNNLRQ